jgi:AcrR family transcriptional regulator
MPKRVDHEERRRQIADALLRTAAARGLHATGMREVAAEAGVSLRLVQYYFGTKEELLLAAMQHLAARFAARAAGRFNEAGGSGGLANPRDVIAAILAEALPADDERRTFHVIYTAYLALSLTDPALAIAPLVKNSDAVTDVVAAQLRAAQAAGDTPVHLDPDLEAFSLMAMSAGLATSVLAGQSSVAEAQTVIDYHLYRLFPASRPALRRSLLLRKQLVDGCAVLQPGRIPLGRGGHCVQLVRLPGPCSVGDDEVALQVAVVGDLGGGPQEGRHQFLRHRMASCVGLRGLGVHRHEHQVSFARRDDQVACGRGTQCRDSGAVQDLVPRRLPPVQVDFREGPVRAAYPEESRLVPESDVLP